MIRVGDWIQTFSGGQFYPLSPLPHDLKIMDIAHALSNTCRFTGHCQRFYSVAEHSVYVSRICDPSDALWGLLHDAAEAYICDMSRPLKKHSRLGVEYSLVEEGIMKCICERYGLTAVEPESVKLADKRMLYVEARELMGPLGPGWDKWKANLTGDEPHPAGVHPGTACAWFLERFLELTEGQL